MEYKAEVRVDGIVTQVITQISLNHLENWEQTVSFPANNPNSAMKVEFLLYRTQDIAPYRQLILWVKVFNNG
jgi:uncharacterized membrane protein